MTERQKELLSRAEESVAKGDLGKLQHRIKQGKINLPPMTYEGDKICFALDLLAKEYPMMPIPHATLYAIVGGIKSIPISNNPNVKLLRSKVSGLNKKMMKTSGRTIVTLAKEGAVRASVDDEDKLTHSAIKANRRIVAAINTANQMSALIDVDNIKETDANREGLEFYKKMANVRDKITKLLPAPPSPKIMAALSSGNNGHRKGQKN